MATLRWRQPAASRRAVRCAWNRAVRRLRSWIGQPRRHGILPSAIAELHRQWRCTELPESSAKLWRVQLGPRLPEFTVIRTVYFAQLLGAA